MADDSTKKYTTSDFTVLNKHFDQALARDNEIVRARRAATFWSNVKSWSLLLFFIGITAMFLAKAYQLMKTERLVEVERIVERVIEKRQQESQTSENKNFNGNSDSNPSGSSEQNRQSGGSSDNSNQNYQGGGSSDNSNQNYQGGGSSGSSGQNYQGGGSSGSSGQNYQGGGSSGSSGQNNPAAGSGSSGSSGQNYQGGGSSGSSGQNNPAAGSESSGSSGQNNPAAGSGSTDASNQNYQGGDSSSTSNLDYKGGNSTDNSSENYQGDDSISSPGQSINSQGKNTNDNLAPKNESGGIIDQNLVGKNDVPIVKDVIQFFFAFPKLDDNRVITVGTRHNYKDPRDPRPYKQSCYILVGKPAVMINLSSKKGEGSIYGENFDRLTLKNSNITLEDINSLQSYCQYI